MPDFLSPHAGNMYWDWTTYLSSFTIHRVMYFLEIFFVVIIQSGGGYVRWIESFILL